MSRFTSSFQPQDISAKQNIETNCVPAFLMSATSQGLGGWLLQTCSTILQSCRLKGGMIRYTSRLILTLTVLYTGVAWGCRWTYEENGVWREVCYCEDRDGCNGSSNLYSNTFLISLLSLLTVWIWNRLWMTWLLINDASIFYVNP